MKYFQLTLTLAGLFLLGCVPIPIPTQEHNYCYVSWADNCYQFRTRGEITDKTLEFMREGSTKKEEVLLTLGAPDSAWKNEKIFAYEWLVVRGYIMLVVPAPVPTALGAQIANFRKYVLLVQFDERNLVARHEIKARDGLVSPINADFIERW
jgi:hypothetical protein